MGRSISSRTGMLIYCPGEPVEEGLDGSQALQAMWSRIGEDWGRLFAEGVMAPKGSEPGYFEIAVDVPDDRRSEADGAFRKWFEDRNWALAGS
jgi:hypothetical protein